MLERYNDFLRHLDPFIPLQSLSQRNLYFKTSMNESSTQAREKTPATQNEGY